MGSFEEVFLDERQEMDENSSLPDVYITLYENINFPKDIGVCTRIAAFDSSTKLHMLQQEFGLKYYFLKKNYKNNFDFKLLSNLVRLDHVSDR